MAAFDSTVFTVGGTIISCREGGGTVAALTVGGTIISCREGIDGVAGLGAECPAPAAQDGADRRMPRATMAKRFILVSYNCANRFSVALDRRRFSGAREGLLAKNGLGQMPVCRTIGEGREQNDGTMPLV
jgi:hypothetical protein